MTFQEKYELNFRSADFFAHKFDLLILGGETDSKDIRTTKVKTALTKFNGKILYLRTDNRAELLSYDLIDCDAKVLLSSSDSKLIPDLRKLLRQLTIDQLTVCLDITCLQQAIIFLITRLLVSEIKPKDFFAAYTEPEDYISKVQNGDNDEGEEYELYDEIVGLNYTVPGFSKISRKKKSLLVASLGFEKQRLISLFENLEPTDGMVPILGFPAFSPGMNLTALLMNYKVLEDSGAEGLIETCEASSPFMLYNILEEIEKAKGEEQEILVAPL